MAHLESENKALRQQAFSMEHLESEIKKLREQAFSMAQNNLLPSGHSTPTIQSSESGRVVTVDTKTTTVRVSSFLMKMQCLI
ncbi:hypothetical protein ACLOJK_032306 [Asimina triloba]